MARESVAGNRDEWGADKGPVPRATWTTRTDYESDAEISDIFWGFHWGLATRQLQKTTWTALLAYRTVISALVKPGSISVY